ncbi:hypothetical protein CVT25_012416 [Psilocybe cyanescens]|uniref:Uncharacterized protein n=1 Tax=Psilocybe cyanescens TaxID=93625 RepID=A0A409X7S5_PSICY|nr:hypothetical protein CVT25_012416 [Psilocybe cyanescens]
MAAPARRRRPLPSPPAHTAAMQLWQNQYSSPISNRIYSSQDPYIIPSAYPPYAPYPPSDHYEEPLTISIPARPFLYKGFYDLLVMIPIPPSRLLWKAHDPPAEPVLAGPRYEDLERNTATRAMPKKGQRVSKETVSKPTGFVVIFTFFSDCDLINRLVHASDADQLEALLTRWGPDGVGKLGDPHWANPIKNYIRQRNQEKVINEVISVLKPSQGSRLSGPLSGQLHVATSSSLTTAARENVVFTSPCPDGLPGRTRNSTLRWGGLRSHREVQEMDNQDPSSLSETEQVVKPPRLISPSLATLEKAVAARIYFEILYFPLFRHPSSQEQRK